MLKLRNTTAIAAIASALTTGAWAQDQQAIDVPKQPLLQALDELSAETGKPILVRRDLINGLQSKPVAGTMSPRQALERMVGTTDLSVQELEDGSLVVTESDNLSFVSQNAFDEDPFDLGTIVLQGELIDRTAQESQTSAVIISGEELEERGETRLDQIIARTPGITSIDDGGSVTIRGIRTEGPTGVVSGSTITTTIDDIRLGPSASDFGSNALSTWDLEQVEILRGPQSTQSGRNALAGAVRLISNDPVFENQYRLRVGFGNNSTAVGSFVLNTPIVQDRLAFRLAVDHEQTDGSVRNTSLGTDDALFAEQTTVRASLRFEPTDRLSTVLRYTYIDEERGVQSLSAADFPPNRIVEEGDQSAFSRTINALSLNIGYEINDQLALESRTTRTDYEFGVIFDADATAAPGIVAQRPGESEVFEQEFRLVYEGANARGVLGFFYLDESFQTTALGSFGGGPFTPFFSAQGDTENFAAFGEIEYDFNDNWRGIFGLRYDVEERDRRSLDGAGAVTQQSDTRFEALLPKLGVVYNFNPDISLGVVYQRGYRAGGSGVNLADLANPRIFSFDPEYTDNFELSFRSEQMGGDLIFNANAFYTDWTDQQQQIQLSGNPADTITVNSASSELWGGELDVRYQASANMAVFAAVAYVQTEFKNFATIAGGDFSGNSFPYAPELTASFGASYVFSNGITISGDVNYTGSSFSDPANTQALKNESYWLANLQASYEFANGIQLVGYVKNLFDEDYTIGRFSGGALTGASLNAGEERTFGAFLTARF
ncbi:MAG: TonB-dependent receptor [Pseudomonadota bacterium]